MSDTMLEDQESTNSAQDLSNRIVEATSHQTSLLQQIKEKELQLEARRRTRHEVEHWYERKETKGERRTRLEEKIENLLKEKKSLQQRRTIASGAIRALDHSYLTNSLSSSPDPSPRQIALQELVDERDSLSFALLKLTKDKSEITSQTTQLRKELLGLNRRNVAMAASIRAQSAASLTETSLSEASSSSAQPSSASLYQSQQDELLLTTSRLKVLSFVLQSLIHESGLRFDDSSDAQMHVENSQQSDSAPERLEGRMARLLRLAGEDWDAME